MSSFGLVPFFPRWYDDVSRSHSLFDQYFGMPLRDDDLFDPGMMMPYFGPRRHHHRHPEGQLAPMRSSMDRGRSGLSRVTNDKNQFKVSLDVHQFKPEEVHVKTVDNYVTIEGRHDEKEDEHGYISRHFVRKYLLPEGVKAEEVTSTLSSDGVLSVTAPKQMAIEKGGAREIPISRSPFPALGSTTAAAQNGHPSEKEGEKAASGEPMEK
ncbi:unnamed protein product [Notodromas monacha]|uniref:SHSP domain-containing protein n=1 Tax=Notodromas monacha TaxID=399045 RepID=A0A7R9GF50_9CRUS|nr:unnamed protein product [Notodromas monacha]CAG0918490.1 unnamed protein product [Notodromas monacha]